MFKSRALILFLALTLLAGCTLARVTSITGSGNVVTQEETLTGFDKVDVSHAFEVEVSQGEAFSVVVHIDDNLVQHLRVDKRGRTLEVGLRPGRMFNIRQATMQAEVTMPELTGVELSGASHATLTGFKSTKALEVDLSGASSLRGDIEAGNVRFDLSGASDVTLTGSGRDVAIDASGASEVDLAGFPMDDADVDLSGASEATVNPSGRLNVDASGASDVYYLGSPTLGRIDESSGSQIRRR